VVNFFRRINALGAAAFFNVRTKFGQWHIEQVISEVGDTAHERAVVAKWYAQNIFQKFPEKWRILLCAAIVLGADVIQISAVSKRIPG